MTRKEYLEQKNKAAETPAISTEVDTNIDGLGKYLDTRRSLENFETHMNIADELTSEDYLKFDMNFDTAIESLKYEDDCMKSAIERSIAMMDADGWKWCNHNPTAEEFENKIRSLYEEAVSSGYAVRSVETGGIAVKTDIYDHTVNISFGPIGISSNDFECV
jgi:hypothetical protein